MVISVWIFHLIRSSDRYFSNLCSTITVVQRSFSDKLQEISTKNSNSPQSLVRKTLMGGVRERNCSCWTLLLCCHVYVFVLPIVWVEIFMRSLSDGKGYLCTLHSHSLQHVVSTNIEFLYLTLSIQEISSLLSHLIICYIEWRSDFNIVSNKTYAFASLMSNWPTFLKIIESSLTLYTCAISSRSGKKTMVCTKCRLTRLSELLTMM